LRPAAFYETLNRECGARGWRIRQFSEWLGLDDKLYKWRGKKQPRGLPEAETLIQIAVRLGWELDRLLRGVSAAYDAQVAARAVNTGMEQTTTREKNRDSSDWAKLHNAVTKPDPITAETLDQRRALLDLLTPEQWTLVRVILSLGPEDAAHARKLIKRLMSQRDPVPDAATEPNSTQGGSAKTSDPGPDR
jgi:hypothetical protein